MCRTLYTMKGDRKGKLKTPREVSKPWTMTGLRWTTVIGRSVEWCDTVLKLQMVYNNTSQVLINTQDLSYQQSQICWSTLEVSRVTITTMCSLLPCKGTGEWRKAAGDGCKSCIKAHAMQQRPRELSGLKIRQWHRCDWIWPLGRNKVEKC